MRTAALLLAAAAVSLAAGCRNGAGSGPAQPMPNVTPIDTRASAEPAVDDAPPTPRPPKEADPTSTDAFEGTAGATDKPRAGAEGRGPARRANGPARARRPRRVRVRGRRGAGYHIDYIDKPGAPVRLGRGDGDRGRRMLAVRMTPAAALQRRGERHGPVPRARKLALGVAREIERTCDFEAEVTWVLGVSSPNRYRVLELTKPARLVVDVKH